MKSMGAWCAAFTTSATVLLLVTAVAAAPLEVEDDGSENGIEHAVISDTDMSGQWDAIDTAALRKLLLQLDTEERMNRVSRSWPPVPRAPGYRGIDGRFVRPWRTDKRQVRFRQCYFNPISCFRK